MKRLDRIQSPCALLAATLLMGWALPVTGAGEAAAPDEAAALANALEATYQPLDLTYFETAFRQFRRIQENPDYPRYDPAQIVHIAENLLLYQTEDGGWPKNIDWLRIVPPDRLRQEIADHPAWQHATLDNENIWTHADYLARVYKIAGLERHRAASARAIDYLLDHQQATGGWRGADVDAITFNDDVMSGVLTTLTRISKGDEPFGWVDEARRARAAAAVDRGLVCILKCQIRRDGKLTAWCQQHAHDDFRPVGARTYELPSMCTRESVSVVEYLMSIEDPGPDVIAAIEGAVAWLDSVRLHGIRVERRPLETPWKYGGRWIDQDVVTVEDPAAPDMWARYYDLEKSEPLYVKRSGEIVPTFNDINQERRFGYGWLGDWPEELLTMKYPEWRKKHAP
jgi:PelA/Pel-15E family pectate lyase